MAEHEMGDRAGATLLLGAVLLSASMERARLGTERAAHNQALWELRRFGHAWSRRWSSVTSLAEGALGLAMVAGAVRHYVVQGRRALMPNSAQPLTSADGTPT
jgi:hypothetical protein